MLFLDWDGLSSVRKRKLNDWLDFWTDLGIAELRETDKSNLKTRKEKWVVSQRVWFNVRRNPVEVDEQGAAGYFGSPIKRRRNDANKFTVWWMKNTGRDWKHNSRDWRNKSGCCSSRNNCKLKEYISPSKTAYAEELENCWQNPQWKYHGWSWRTSRNCGKNYLSKVSKPELTSPLRNSRIDRRWRKIFIN